MTDTDDILSTTGNAVMLEFYCISSVAL